MPWKRHRRRKVFLWRWQKPSLLTEVSQAARKWEKESAGPRQVLWCTVIRNFGWNQTGFEIPVFRNPGNARIAHVQIYWLLESLRAHVKTDLPRSRFTWLKCHSLPWDTGACSIGFLPGAGRGLSRLSHLLAAWETSVIVIQHYSDYNVVLPLVAWWTH